MNLTPCQLPHDTPLCPVSSLIAWVRLTPAWSFIFCSSALCCLSRLTASLMMHGRNNGKKIKAVEIIRNACEIVHLLTDSNPIQVIVDAVINR